MGDGPGGSAWEGRCVCRRARTGKGSHEWGKGQKGPCGCSQPCTDTAQYCSMRHLHVPHPSLVSQLSLPRPWRPPAAFGAGYLPYGEVLEGVWLFEGAGNRGFGAGMGFGRLWVLPPPGARGAGGRRANRMPGEQKQEQGG